MIIVRENSEVAIIYPDSMDPVQGKSIGNIIFFYHTKDLGFARIVLQIVVSTNFQKYLVSWI
jgi:hypothetical protein